MRQRPLAGCSLARPAMAASGRLFGGFIIFLLVLCLLATSFAADGDEKPLLSILMAVDNEPLVAHLLDLASQLVTIQRDFVLNLIILNIYIYIHDTLICQVACSFSLLNVPRLFLVPVMINLHYFANVHSNTSYTIVLNCFSDREVTDDESSPIRSSHPIRPPAVLGPIICHNFSMIFYVWCVLYLTTYSPRLFCRRTSNRRCRRSSRR